MKKLSHPALALRTETLALLTTTQLAAVAGGGGQVRSAMVSCSLSCAATECGCQKA